MSVRVTDSGIEVPEAYRDERKVVVRTPTSTIDISSGFCEMVEDGLFPFVSPSDFTTDYDPDVQNPSLQPQSVSFKIYGKEAEEFEVEIE